MDQQITALIVDDDQRSREVLSLHLRSIPGITVIGTDRDRIILTEQKVESLEQKIDSEQQPRLREILKNSGLM